MMSSETNAPLGLDWNTGEPRHVFASYKRTAYCGERLNAHARCGRKLSHPVHQSDDIYDDQTVPFEPLSSETNTDDVKGEAARACSHGKSFAASCIECGAIRPNDRCPSCKGDGKIGIGTLSEEPCTDCLGTGLSPSPQPAPTLHCSCGAVVTEDEYREHRLMGHDQPAPEGGAELPSCPFCKAFPQACGHYFEVFHSPECFFAEAPYSNGVRTIITKNKVESWSVRPPTPSRVEGQEPK